MTKDDKTFEENLLELENIVKEYRKNLIVALRVIR